jgi:hypothetical protein
LAAGSNQGDVPLDTNLQASLTIGQSRIFLRQEMLSELGENLRLGIFGEEVGKDALQGSPHRRNIGARQVVVKFKNLESIKEMIVVSWFKLYCSPIHPTEEKKEFPQH